MTLRIWRSNITSIACVVVSSFKVGQIKIEVKEKRDDENTGAVSQYDLETT